MGLKVYFTVPGECIPKSRPRFGKNHFAYTPNRTREYERKFRQYALDAYIPKGWNPNGPFAVRFDVFRSRRVGDIDNRAKNLDALLKSPIMSDDRYILRLIASQYMDKENPRVQVEFEMIDPQ